MVQKLFYRSHVMFMSLISIGLVSWQQMTIMVGSIHETTDLRSFIPPTDCGATRATRHNDDPIGQTFEQMMGYDNMQATKRTSTAVGTVRTSGRGSLAVNNTVFTDFNISTFFEAMNLSTHRKLALPESEWILTDNKIFDHNNAARIPQLLHKVLFTNDGGLTAFQDSSSFLKGVRDANLSWRKKNPGYHIHYYSLRDARAYLRRHYHPVFLRAFDCIQAFAGKADLFRYALVYREGGFYGDWKQECLKDGLLDRLATGVIKHRNTTAVFSTEVGRIHSRRNGYLANGFFGAVPRHPVLARAMELVVLNVQAEYYGPLDTSSTGPGVLGMAMTEIKQQQPMLVESIYFPAYKWNKFSTEGEHTIVHKCDDCHEPAPPNSKLIRHWKGGNDYSYLFHHKQFYCQDAPSILG